MHFPPHNNGANFNWANVKISSSCMPNMNLYTYMHNHNVLNDKPNETDIITEIAEITILVLYQIVVKRNV